jgi:hypothetical protein
MVAFSPDCNAWERVYIVSALLKHLDSGIPVKDPTVCLYRQRLRGIRCQRIHDVIGGHTANGRQVDLGRTILISAVGMDPLQV